MRGWAKSAILGSPNMAGSLLSSGSHPPDHHLRSGQAHTQKLASPDWSSCRRQQSDTTSKPTKTGAPVIAARFSASLARAG
jgi:hypothetical protein